MEVGNFEPVIDISSSLLFEIQKNLYQMRFVGCGNQGRELRIFSF